MAKSRKTRRRSRTHLSVRPILWAAAVLVVGATAVAGAGVLWRALSGRPEFRVDTLAMELTGCPDWVNAALMGPELRAYVQHTPSGESIFDEGLAREVHANLSGCPWVLEVTSVRRRLPNSLAVGAVFRKPEAVVQVNGRQYMVDEDGHWLPEGFFGWPAGWQGNPGPLVADLHLSGAPTVGAPWDEPRLAVGARLVAYLRREGLFDELPLTTVDVTGVGRPSEPDIMLTAASGAQIKWGRSDVYLTVPGLPAPIFATPDRDKLDMLLSKLADYPGLHGVKYVDLRFHGQIVFTEAD